MIGTGLAGLTFALEASKQGSVAVLTKKTRSDANSSWAQGGIAGVLGDNDSFALHTQDTLVAGAGLCHEDAVEILVREGADRIRDLIALGAQFDTHTDDEGRVMLSLGREGGHSRNRIVHTADYTGWECEKTLLEAVKGNPNITVYEHYFVTDLLTERLSDVGARCLGAKVLDSQTGVQTECRAKATLLATGGCGHVYQHTTNPLVATGDGVAMAWRAGATVANMEFIQFHPTTLYHPDARAFLITEALRGEGGILCHADGERFMERYHPLKELAPRDIVARAIVSEMKRRNVPCVYLDATHIDRDLIMSHFPTVYERCLSVGIDITKVPIPIVPAQHYQCGGVVTDLEGRTDIVNLYAAGEVACTGVHGANRLASNSLLEAMVWGKRAALSAIEETADFPIKADSTEYSSEPTVSKMSELPELAVAREKLLEYSRSRVQTLRTEIQKTMQHNVGIVRTVRELEITFLALCNFLIELNEIRHESIEWYETRNIVQVGLKIVACALRRKESRGLHYILDYPELRESERHDTLLKPSEEPIPV